ncbi:MAG: T9SS type A sorting domain-containing protein [Bacteroidales bacterium]|nr:T9SS type A sorting domain-containing protein [Bacteroidales bacterium]
MKKIHIFLILLFIFKSSFSQLNEADTFEEHQAMFSEIDRSEITTGILYDRVIPFSGIEKFTGKNKDAICKQSIWKQMYYELQNASYEKDTVNMPNLKFIFGTKRQFTNGKLIPIYLLNYNYNKIKENAFVDKLLILQNNKIIKNPEKNENPYKVKRAFAAAPYKTHTYYGNDFSFILNGNYLYTNTDEIITEIFVDFDDGFGYRKIKQGTELPVSYAETGQKTVSIKAITQNSDTLVTKFAFEVKAKDIPDYIVVTIESDPINNESTNGELAIIKAPNNDLLDNPFLIVEGFDIMDNVYFEEMWELFNKEHFAECLLENDYDIIFLNFNKPRTDLKVNAQLVRKAIDDINNIYKDRNNELIIAGGSMGGLVTRTALTYMEDNNLKHHTRLFVSFDSPQNGANIPIGLQHLIKFSSEHGNINAEDFINRLNDKAAKQMLLFHHLATDEDNNIAKAHQDKEDFENYINSIGNYPTELRKIAFSNGASDGTILPHPDDDLLLYYKKKHNSKAKDRLWVYAMPADKKKIVFKATWANINAKRVKIKHNYKIDYAPGGIYNTMEIIYDSDQDAFTLYQASHCFIPTISSLDINTTDYNYNIIGDPDIMNKTPFDALYYPDEESGINQFHVNVSEEFAYNLLEEIIPENIILPDNHPFWNEGDVIASNSIQLTQGFHASASNEFHTYIKPRVNCIIPDKSEIFTKSSNQYESSLSKLDFIVENRDNIIIYPNPNYGNCTIKLNYKERPLYYTITDLTGNIIIKKEYTENPFKINNLTAGIYLITIYFKNKVLTEKIIIL